MAGHVTCIDDLRHEAIDAGLIVAVETSDTPVIFDWLMGILSHQGISDAVADGFMKEHGNVTWAQITRALSTSHECQKLQGYWAFSGCLYQKTSQTCAEPAYFPRCPLPRHDLRNGRLNQTAYGLFLFIRDVAGGDVVRWIDHQINAHGYGQSRGSKGCVGGSVTACVWRFRQSYFDGAGDPADGGWGSPTWVVRCRCELHCDRHFGPQLLSANRHRAEDWARSSVRTGMLSRGRLRRCDCDDCPGN